MSLTHQAGSYSLLGRIDSNYWSSSLHPLERNLSCNHLLWLISVCWWPFKNLARSAGGGRNFQGEISGAVKQKGRYWVCLRDFGQSQSKAFSRDNTENLRKLWSHQSYPLSWLERNVIILFPWIRSQTVSESERCSFQIALFGHTPEQFSRPQPKSISVEKKPRHVTRMHLILVILVVVDILIRLSTRYNSQTSCSNQLENTSYLCTRAFVQWRGCMIRVFLWIWLMQKQCV